MPQFPNVLDVAGITLTRDATWLLLSLRTAPEPDGRRAPVARWLDLVPALGGLDLQVDELAPRSWRRMHHIGARLWVRSRQGKLNDDRIDDVRRALAPHLSWVGPAYRPAGTQGVEALECPLPHVLVVRPALPFATGEFDTLTPALDALGLVEVPEKSRYLGGLRYFVVRDPTVRNAYGLRKEILHALGREIADVLFEFMPMVSPLADVPRDEWFGSQWGMTRIQAPEAWDIATPDPDLIIAVIDGGCDLTHEDLSYVTGRGRDLETMSGDGSPLSDPRSGLPITHGTWVAGVAAARMNNTVGVAGVAGGCRILPLASTFTDMELAAGIRYALDEGASVINMSVFTAWSTFLTGPIPSAIEEAERRGCVLVGSAGDGNGGAGLVRPGEHPLVMACGATDMDDERWVVRRADGSVLAESSWGDSTIDGEATGVSVMAPGERIFTTDLMGAAGATTFNYTDVFNATSASAPFAAGLAALLQSRYPALRTRPARVRSIIERTAEKVGPLPYTDMEGFPHGTRNPQLGYGRISAHRAVDFGDVLIRDWSGDDGTEPSTPPGGNFYSYSDIVVRPEDDDVFMPGDAIASSHVVRGRSNCIYVQVHNTGPATARDVVVDVRVTPYVGLEFVYPDDWRRLDDDHVQPAALVARFDTVAAGAPPVTAKFSLTAEQVDRLWDWTERSWHPCVLAQVTAANDYAFGGETLRGGALIVRRNNIAQRNLTVVATTSMELRAFRFVAGNAASADDRIDLVVRAGPLASRGDVLLCLGPPPSADPGKPPGDCGCDDEGMVFLDRTRVEVCAGGCRGVLTLEKGSRFTAIPSGPRMIPVRGSEHGSGDGTCVRITEPVAVIQLSKRAYATVALSLAVRVPSDARPGERFPIDVSQRNQGRTVGGALAVFVVGEST